MKSSFSIESPKEAPALTRRAFTLQSVRTLLSFSLIETLCRQELFAENVSPEMIKWLNDVNELGAILKQRDIEPTAWQPQIETLFRQVDMTEIFKFIDFDRIDRKAKPPKRGAQSIRFKYPQIAGVPEKLAFGQQIFALRKGRSVVPHGHNNMATAFLILKGEFQGKHYDRLEDEKEHLIIKPTIDRKFTPGDYSTVSDYKDNVHWFKALEEPAYIFNIHILDVAPKAKRRTGRVYVDPNGEKIADGLIRARRINYERAHKLYG
ncbi:MAG TPA: hypothetical protein EYQ50_00930 [Verrucomicrobiales bacterium]|jgi:hypothetical protein|nr:hypothetical protein [Verrucomicrobiales bacterium]HIL72544.1 hypothetical protein [Verrucomicrobiota bacterium]